MPDLPRSGRKKDCRVDCTPEEKRNVRPRHRVHRYATVIYFSVSVPPFLSRSLPRSIYLYLSARASVSISLPRSSRRPSKRSGISLKSRQKVPVSFSFSHHRRHHRFSLFLRILIHPRCFIPPSPRTRQQKRGQSVDNMCFPCRLSDPLPLATVSVEYRHHPGRQFLLRSLPQFSFFPLV